MTIDEAIISRHSVRKYTDQKIDDATKEALQQTIDECNREGNLKIKLFTDDPTAFNGLMARFGSFKNVRNCIAMIGTKSDDLDERAGYYGEQIVLKAAMLGLNTCWVGLTYNLKAKSLANGEDKLVCMISLGYGVTQGVQHKNRPIEAISHVEGETPDWFHRGLEYALLAPTAMNQQHFIFSYDGNKVKAEATGGFFDKVDLGIVEYHFEIGSGKKIFFQKK